MKIRLIEPNAPSMHLWSKSYFVRLGLPIIGATLKEAGHDVRIYNPQLAPIDWDDVFTSQLVGLSCTTSTAPAAYDIADELRRRRIPVVIGGSHVTFMADEALRARRLRGARRGRRADHARDRRRHGGPHAGGRRHRHLVPAQRRDRAQPAARALHRPRYAPVPRPRSRGRQRAPLEHPHHDQLGLPVRLHLLLGDGDVRQEVPLPQRRERDRRDQAEEPEEDLLLRRQHGGQPQAPQAAAAHDDRRGHPGALGRAGAHRRGDATRSCWSSCRPRGPISWPSASSP